MIVRGKCHMATIRRDFLSYRRLLKSSRCRTSHCSPFRPPIGHTADCMTSFALDSLDHKSCVVSQLAAYNHAYAELSFAHSLNSRRQQSLSGVERRSRNLLSCQALLAMQHPYKQSIAARAEIRLIRAPSRPVTVLVVADFD